MIGRFVNHMYPDISFVVPVFNHLSETQEMLRTLRASLPEGLNYEVVLIDDGSTDGVENWLHDFKQHDTIVLFNDENHGYAFSCNRGASHAKGYYLCFINSDLEFADGWLEPMLSAFNDGALNAGLVGNVQHRVSDGTLDHAGVHLSVAGFFVHSRPKVIPDKRFEKVLCVTGACMLMRRDVFLNVGGFDQQFSNGAEDYDLAYKIRREGLNVIVSYESRIRHHVSLSRGSSSHLQERNSRCLFEKWRKEIKEDLAAVWFADLKEGGAWDTSVLPGSLSLNFLSSPHLASQIVAQSVVGRLKSYWARHLDGEIPASKQIGKMVVQGLSRVPDTAIYMAADKVEVLVEGLESARNFYICGFRADKNDKREIVVSIEVNGIQTVAQIWGQEFNLNLGMINPLWFSSCPTMLRISFEYIASEVADCLGAGSSILITHFVIDDDELRALECFV